MNCNEREKLRDPSYNHLILGGQMGKWPVVGVSNFAWLLSQKNMKILMKNKKADFGRTKAKIGRFF